MLAANILGLPKDEFELACNHASAVIHLQDPGKDLELDTVTDVSCPYPETNQNVLVKLDKQLAEYLGGSISLYHKSFNDFLSDPARSGSYCVKESEALAKRSFKAPLDYDRCYCWHGSKLIPAPGTSNSALSLSYPHTNELANSLIKARVYSYVGSEDSEDFSPPGGLGWLDADCDFRKRLQVLTHLFSATRQRSSLLWGHECLVKLYPGTRIMCISGNGFSKFDTVGFKSMIHQRQRANVIRWYHPNLASRIKSLFRGKPRGHSESAVYHMGQGDKSIFWYWEIDYELQHYRECRTIDLAEGEKLFREENFALWPEYGYEFESEFGV